MTEVKLRSATSEEQDDKHVFVRYINQEFSQDKDIKHMLPLSEEDNSLFNICASGIILSKMVNKAAPGVINEKRINTQRPLSRVQQIENANMAVEGAKALGCRVVSVKGSDIADAKPAVILGLLWQVLLAIYESRINMTNHPELIALKGKYEDLYKLEKVSVKDKLLRWLNFHLFQEKHSPIKKFPGDLKKGHALEVLFKRVAPQEWEAATSEQAEAEEGQADIDVDLSRCQCVANAGAKVLGEDNPVSITAQDIYKGARILEVFCIAIFESRNGLEITGDRKQLARDIVEARFRAVSEQLPDVKSPQLLSLLQVAHHFKEAIANVRSQTRNLLMAQEEALEAQNAALKGAEELHTENEDLLSKKSQLEDQLAQAESEKSQVQQQLRQLQEELEQEKKKSQQYEAEVEQLRQESQDTQSRQEQSLNALREEFAAERQQLQDQHQENVLKVSQEHKEHMAQINQENERKVSEITETAEKYQKAAEEAENKRQEELATEKQQQEILKAQLNRSEESNSELQTEVSSLKNKIEAFETTSKSLLGEIQRTRENFRFVLTLAGVEGEEKLAKWRYPKMAAVQITDPQYHGYLTKRGSNWKSWKRRYFVLKNDWLFYYSGDMSDSPSGFLCLVGCTCELVDKTETKKDFSFKFVTATRSLLCSAATEEERDKWIEVATKYTNLDQSYLVSNEMKSTSTSTTEVTDQ